MPLVRIALAEGKSEEYRQAVSDGIHQAMVETINVPTDDRFQIIAEHRQGTLVYDPQYLGINRDEDIIFIQITLNVGRSVEQKKALYHQISERLAASPGVRPGNLFVNLVETDRENWSFGDGIAQYA